MRGNPDRGFIEMLICFLLQSLVEWYLFISFCANSLSVYEQAKPCSLYATTLVCNESIFQTRVYPADCPCRIHFHQQCINTYDGGHIQPGSEWNL